MNEMYKYLQEHSYISENKKSKYQSELSEQRAECIANKYNSLVQDLKQENQKYKAVIDKLNFIKNRKNQGASQENINKMAIKFVNSYLKEVSNE